MEKIKAFFNFKIGIGDAQLTLGSFLIWILIIVALSFFLRLLRKILTRKLSTERKGKFKPIFLFLNYSLYTVVVLLALQNAGVNLNALLAASAALLVGVGFALQTFFQDIISGIFILIDQTVHVGDVIELDGKVCKVEHITLRTTRAVTVDNKVLIIPNHMYLTTTIYNWTENEDSTREHVSIGVAYGTDLEKLKKLMVDLACSHVEVLKSPAPILLFKNFGESSLDFDLIFTLKDGFKTEFVKSDIRYAIDKTLRENDITIPFPQRVIHKID
jgi:small-conductance mechanosensitive channel